MHKQHKDNLKCFVSEKNVGNMFADVKYDMMAICRCSLQLLSLLTLFICIMRGHGFHFILSLFGSESPQMLTRQRCQIA